MTGNRELQTRRGVIVGALAAGGATALLTAGAGATTLKGETAMTGEPLYTGGPHDWDFLAGHWSVRHRRLKARLVGNTDWEEFAGTCVMWPTLDGAGNVDDNVLELPGGTYRAMGLRAFDAKTRQWSIWWLDARYPTRLDPPVRGGFRDGVGTFLGDDTLNGRPIKVRFRWSEITATSARWEQAFSPDGGATWETNWTMQFTRTKS